MQRLAASGRSTAVRRAATKTTAQRRRSMLQPGETPRTRGERTRQRVAEALITLIGEGDMSPTAKAIAERADVSVRLVFHHFQDMDALYRLVVDVQARRNWDAVDEVPATLPLDDRIERTVRLRGRLYEAVGPVRRSLVPVLPRNSEISDAVAGDERRLRGLLETTFSPELGAAGRSKRDLLDGLDASSSWEAWERLRRSQGLGAAASRRVMARTLGGLLAR
ncbi:MAG: TetR/AcrR family transcriptional regulator [Acidimicrobiales bacterium]